MVTVLKQMVICRTQYHNPATGELEFFGPGIATVTLWQKIHQEFGEVQARDGHPEFLFVLEPKEGSSTTSTLQTDSTSEDLHAFIEQWMVGEPTSQLEETFYVPSVEGALTESRLIECVESKLYMENGFSALILAAAAGNMELVNQFCNLETVNDMDTLGRNGLWWAAANDEFETLSFLLQNGLFPNVCTFIH